MKTDSTLLSIPAISVISGDEFGTIEHVVEVNLSHLESIRGRHVFTKEVYHEMTRKQQWGKGFGLMKKHLIWQLKREG